MPAINTDKQTSSIEIVTPDKARAYLQTVEGNRPLDKGHVRALADDIEHNRWRLTHQGIAFDKQGHLKDGQHRMHAIIAAGKAVPIQVTRNLTDDAMSVIDQHRRRTAAQILAIVHNIRTDAPRLTAMARAILAVVHNQTRVSNDAASDYAAQHVDVFKRYLRVAREYTPAVGAAFAWADMQGWDEVQSAAQRLTDAMWTGQDDPMRALWTRSKSFRKEVGQPGIKRKFDVALACLQAVHEGRGMLQVRTVQPDYQAIASESQRPNGGQA